MTTRRSAFLLFVVALVAAPALMAGTEVPLKGFALLNSIPAPNSDGCAAGEMRMNVTGSGNLTHLGKFTDASFVCLNGTTSPPTFTVHGVLTAANGDLVYLEAAGTTMPSSQTQMTIDGHFTISGGTGRFEHATGEGAVTGSTDMVTGLTPHWLDGTISTAGSNKR